MRASARGTLLPAAALFGAAASVSGPDLAAQGRGAGEMVVTTSWLASRLSDPSVVVLHVDRTDSLYRSGHVPGARFVRYASLSVTRDSVPTELPSADSVESLFESLGVSDGSHVVLTGPPLVVTRAYFTLDWLGHPRVSVLQGGASRWRAEGRPLSTDTPVVRRGSLTPRVRQEIVAPLAWVRERVGKPGFALLDTRTEREYLGIAAGRGPVTEGHIPGARRVEWQDFFRDPADSAARAAGDPAEFTLRSPDVLGRLWRERVAPGDTVIAYCTVGYRASSSYFVSKLLAYPVKVYDGSYAEWALRKLPLEKAPVAPRAPRPR